MGAEQLAVGVVPVSSRRTISTKVTDRFLSIPVAYEESDITELIISQDIHVNAQTYLPKIERA